VHKLIKALAAAGAVTIGLVCATACGSTTSGLAATTTYAPAAYGQGNECYYISTPAEVTALIAAGLCPRGSVATPMPLSWEETYWAYYSSPAYYDTYVPSASRTVYTHDKTTFGKTYRTAITSLASHATYKSSSGTTVHGYKTSTVHFGSGTSFGSSGQKYGSGSLRTGTSKTSTSKTGTSVRTGGGSYSHGYGSGSLRSGSSGSSSHTSVSEDDGE
jgi:hypothetical protein